MLTHSYDLLILGSVSSAHLPVLQPVLPLPSTALPMKVHLWNLMPNSLLEHWPQSAQKSMPKQR